MKKGFTLIELLAVIVILAIIALIATPIVLDIINDAKESATLRSSEFYLSGVEQVIATLTLNNTSLKDGTYKIQGGDICIDSVCIEKLEVKLKGEVPTTGNIIIKSGQVDEMLLVMDNNKMIVKDDSDKLIYFENEYKIGDKVTFNPGNGDKEWNVIDEDRTTVTLMLSENLGNIVQWYAYSNHNSYDNSYGPKDALEALNAKTEGWTNVDSIKNYTYINNLNGTAKPNGYQKIEITDGKSILTHKDGEIITEVKGITKARLLTKEDVIEIATKTNKNLKEENIRLYIERNLETINTKLNTSSKTVDDVIETLDQILPFTSYETSVMKMYITVNELISTYGIETTYDISLPSYLHQNLYSNDNTTLPDGYWTLSTMSNSLTYAWLVYKNGREVSSDVCNYYASVGIRPVITVPKSKLAK